MTKILRELRILLLSPNDVEAERRIMERVIRNLNDTIAQERNLYLYLSYWETDSYPGFHPEGHQGLVDPSLKIEDWDILIGIFWKRFGTPTKRAQWAQSGTEHEIRTAVGSWLKLGHPQVMIFFKEAEFLPQKDDLQQYGQMLQFREEFAKEGLYLKFKEVSEFEKLVMNRLVKFIMSYIRSEEYLSVFETDVIPPNVFLCHASEDKPIVRELYERLENSGVKPWLDEIDLLPGQDWDLEIKRAVQRADAVVVLLSHNSTTKRGYLQREIRTALDTADEQPEDSIFLIPARLEECKVPESLQKWQYVDLFKPNAFEQLIKSLKSCASTGGEVK